MIDSQHVVPTFATQTLTPPPFIAAVETSASAPERRGISHTHHRVPAEETGRVLVIDDDRDLCRLVCQFLDLRGHQATWRDSHEDALEVLRDGGADVVVADIRLGESDGLRLCEEICAAYPDLPVVVITAYGSMDLAVESMRAGAYDFLNKPFELDSLALTIHRAMRHRRLEEEVKHLQRDAAAVTRFDQLVGSSRPMRRIYEIIPAVASTDASVLISGESGTGKELVARAIHGHSARASGPFVAINCAAMPSTLLESELFGHVRGAFTDAQTTRPGLFLKADTGTLFLDELGEMPLDMQAKLLRVLQERRVRPVGGDTEKPFDTRILAATNRDLEREVQLGRFREDLFYRINVVTILAPPLRDRGNDMLLLAQLFIERAAKRMNKGVTSIAPAAAERLLSYDWPGNVRELENCIERAVTLTKYDHISVDDLPSSIRAYERPEGGESREDPGTMPSLEAVQNGYILEVLRALGGNKTKAAEILGLDRRTLYRRLRRIRGEEN